MRRAIVKMKCDITTTRPTITTCSPISLANSRTTTASDLSVKQRRIVSVIRSVRGSGDETDPAPNPPPRGIDPALAPGVPSNSYDHPRSTTSVRHPTCPRLSPSPSGSASHIRITHTINHPRHLNRAPQPTRHPTAGTSAIIGASRSSSSASTSASTLSHAVYDIITSAPIRPLSAGLPPSVSAATPVCFTAYDPYPPPPPQQQQSVPAYAPGAGGYYQYGRSGEACGQYAPPPLPPGPEAQNSAGSRNPPAYGQYQPPPPQQPPPLPAISSPGNTSLVSVPATATFPRKWRERHLRATRLR